LILFIQICIPLPIWFRYTEVLRSPFRSFPLSF
jgi:hypothetical protein